MSDYIDYHLIFKHINSSRDIFNIAKTNQNAFNTYNKLTDRTVSDQRIKNIIEKAVYHICGNIHNNYNDTKLIFNTLKLQNGLNTINVKYDHITGPENVTITFYYCTIKRVITSKLKATSKEHPNVQVLYHDKNKSFKVYCKYKNDKHVITFKYIHYDDMNNIRKKLHLNNDDYYN